jgi:hypothetical protein
MAQARSILHKGFLTAYLLLAVCQSAAVCKTVANSKPRL